MSVVSPSYSVSATNYGRQPTNSYYSLALADTHVGSYAITGNLTVEGTSDLQGAVTADSSLAVAGALSAASVAATGAVTAGSVGVTSTAYTASFTAGAGDGGDITFTPALPAPSAARVGVWMLTGTWNGTPGVSGMFYNNGSVWTGYATRGGDATSANGFNIVPSSTPPAFSLLAYGNNGAAAPVVLKFFPVINLTLA